MTESLVLSQGWSVRSGVCDPVQFSFLVKNPDKAALEILTIGGVRVHIVELLLGGMNETYVLGLQLVVYVHMRRLSSVEVEVP